ncbi:hypothetical protein [Muricoccus radiodurans]|uniref:hypothetical protein n=1 Tax=Muricoccus radiodurans TaxID=2231721 RepID=UPI003CF881A8
MIGAIFDGTADVLPVILLEPLSLNFVQSGRGKTRCAARNGPGAWDAKPGR